MYQEWISHSRKGSIEIICGGMFSGKTEELLRRIRRAELANLRVLVFKPAVDVRYHDTMVVSHDTKSIDARAVKHPKEIDEILLKYTSKDDLPLIALDEAQFFPNDLLSYVQKWADIGHRVICGGLDMDYNRNPFGSMPQLMAIADFVSKFHAICGKCGDMAIYSYCTIDTQKQIFLGDTKEYLPLCRSCYLTAHGT